MSREAFYVLEPIDITKYISSYKLKHCLFFILQLIENGEMVDVEPCQFAWAYTTYGELIHQLETKGYVDVWYDETEALLDCTYQDILSCCQKMRLILAISNSILASRNCEKRSNGKPSRLATEVRILLKKI